MAAHGGVSQAQLRRLQVTGAGLNSTSALCSFQMFGPGLFAAAGHIQHQAEEFLAHVFDGGRAVGDRAGVDVHQVVPAPRQVAAGGDLDHWHGGQDIGSFSQPRLTTITSPQK